MAAMLKRSFNMATFQSNRPSFRGEHLCSNPESLDVRYLLEIPDNRFRDFRNDDS